MTGSILLHGGEVLTDSGLQRTDVLVRDGEIAGLGEGVAGETSVDCSGCWIGPGFVDLHTHLREPGQEHKEDMASGAAAASAGGYTAILAMPNTAPAIDTADRVAASLGRAREISTLDIGVAGAVTEGRMGERLADLEGMLAEGVRWFTDDGDSVASAGLLHVAFQVLHGNDATISEHAEDASLTAGAIMNAGEVADLLGVRGMPALAETLIIARDIQVVRATGGSLHIQHVSTGAAVELIAAAKEEGLPVTAEATPHHLAFDHTELEHRDPRFKMKPPLRTASDVANVRAALVDGTIDLVATDHAPHSEAETIGAGLEDGAFGVIGLETAAAAITTWLGPKPEVLFDRMSIAPARIGGFSRHGKVPVVGAPANLVVFDPTAEWVPTEFRSRSANCPWIGRAVRGRVRATIFEGAISFQYGSMSPQGHHP
ncbi:MAG: dihydroorotase [Acidimicrobiia bacterium]|nr:dihydroorotase [Acidimicrobiia bacterium]